MKVSSNNLKRLNEEFALGLIESALNKQKIVKIRFLGNSMIPTITNGEMIVLKKESPYSIKMGEIVVFNRGNGIIGHRVIWKINLDKLYLLTRGDNTVSYDFPVPAEAVYGKVIISNAKKDMISKINLTIKLFHIICIILFKLESKISTRKPILTLFNKKIGSWIDSTTKR